jgi:hypothetical protein
MKDFLNKLHGLVSIAPLAVFRFLFGFMMLVSTARFIAKDWISPIYIEPKFHFTYYGFDWVQSLGNPGMYLLFGILLVSSFLIMVGWFYRIAMPLFFIVFTYVELIEKSVYLNHYYFVSLVAFLMIWLPANRAFSLDVKFRPSLKQAMVPQWTIWIIMAQLGIVYIFAGISKLNAEWLFDAMPLKIWLAPKSHMPVIGSLLDETWLAYAFSWFGCIYDLFIVFFLLYSKTRKLAYVAVVAFHLITALLFPIGVFPFVMIVSTLIFFPASFHQKIISFIRGMFVSTKVLNQPQADKPAQGIAFSTFRKRFIVGALGLYFVIQILLPFRYLLYPGNLFWTEQGYRFSWRVMLMEKAGKAFFYVKDPNQPGKVEVRNSDYLTPLQEKMMATQPDMIIQYAHFLEAEYQKQGIAHPIIQADIYVSINGKGSRLFIDPELDLTTVETGFANKTWILPDQTPER